MPDQNSPPRYLLVSNRLPVNAVVEEGKLAMKVSTGGLATALSKTHGQQETKWIGWPGDTSAFEPQVRDELDAQLGAANMAPVHLTAEQITRFYEGYCNEVLWPFFHYLLDKIQLDSGRDWAVYQEVNELFADAVARHYQPGDRVWVHDYQLCLVPMLLRKRLPEASIAFFLHIPFPASSVFRILPHRREILEGLIGADLIGFHTHSYQRHFFSSLLRVLGLESNVDTITYEGRKVRVGAFPISIDTAHFEEVAAREEVFAAGQAIRAQHEGVRILLGVDRVDYTKGMIRRVKAIERLLETCPELIGQFKFIQVAAPSRTNVKAYMELRSTLDELVGRVNGRFSTLNWSPILYLFKPMDEQELLALYQAADVMVVTPLRDGMNLVCKEFVASRVDQDGVLVLSEFAGAAWELGEALLVNPYDVDAIARALRTALAMPENERRLRMRRLRKRVGKWTVHDWLASFDQAFSQIALENLKLRETVLMPRTEVRRMKEAGHLVLVLDYDGTLVPFASLPDLASPDAELLQLLRAVIARPNTEVHLASGRERDTMKAWFGELGVTLHAEHGFWSLEPGQAKWQTHAAVETGWKEQAREIMEEFAARTPGSLVEEKTAALCWHYRRCDPHFAGVQERELRLHLADLFRNQPVEVLRGNKIVEIRQQGIHKGLIITALKAIVPEGTLLAAIGDDTTDEDMFARMPDDGISIHVGQLTSQAKYQMTDYKSVRALLQEIASN